MMSGHDARPEDMKAAFNFIKRYSGRQKSNG
jgi:hypothetical protein